MVRSSSTGGTGSSLVVPAILDAMPGPAFLVDADGILRHTNAVWVAAAAAHPDPRMHDVGPGSDYLALIRGMAATPGGLAFADEVAALLRGEVTDVRRDVPMHGASGTVWFRLHARRVDDSGTTLVTHFDVTEELRANRESEWLARHDLLTELPNRGSLLARLDDELRRPAADPVALLAVDVDGFTEVNDSLGHEGGDELLRQIARRLRAVTRRDDVVARLDGDEFSVLCPAGGQDGAVALAERCRGALDWPFEVAGRTVRLSAAMGIAVAARGSGTRAAGLVRDADLAVHAAQASGRNRLRVYTPELLVEAERRAALSEELREAIATGQLVLHYQPVVHLPSGACTGVEALVRWEHPRRGLLGPAEFLPIAEQYELMVPLTRWVLHEAARQTVAWDQGGTRLVTAMNVHPGHLSTGTLVSDVRTALAEAGLAPEQLVVELTEAAVVEDGERAGAQFAELREAGIEVAIDDFGSGYSSLGRLATVPASHLKIDRSLVAFAAGERRRATATIAAVVALGEACGIRSLAEGVETAEQLELATLLGCVYAQGFHIARPMPADQVPAWVAAWDARCEGAAGAARTDPDDDVVLAER